MPNDFDAWYEYRKSVRELDKKTAPRTNNQGKIDPRKIAKNKRVIDRSYCSRQQAVLLSRIEQRRFKSESCLDLHGHNRNTMDLEEFCINCIERGMKNITIITGKGEGILRKAVYNWIQDNPHMISGFFEIRDKSGGVGSFGIRLKSKF
jgi:DNA-nicking Smr family endonuclease